MCGPQYTEIFAFDQPPLKPAFDLARRMSIDLWTGYQASDVCKGPQEQAVVLNVTDKWARDWLETGAGRNWLENHDLPTNPRYAPDKQCSASDPQPILEFKLNDGEVITSPILDIKGSVAVSNGEFKKWVLEYGQGEDPSSWSSLNESNSPVKDNLLYSWNLANKPNGIITLRLTLIGDNTQVDKRVTLNLSLPTPTVPPVTPTVTSIPPTDTLIPTSTPTDTPIPTATPTETPTP